MQYKFRLKEGRKTIPVVAFEDPDFALAGEFLLAERGFLGNILDLLRADGDGSLSGNAFTLEKRGGNAVLTNDLTGESLTVSAAELAALTADYRAEVKRYRQRKPSADNNA